MNALAKLVIWIAAIVFSLIGASGIVFGAWEFSSLIPLQFDTLGPEHVTLNNQLRFLKATELSVGVLLFAVRRDVFSVRRVNLAVLVALLATPAARIFSLLIDGTPNAMFSALLVVELCGGAIVALNSLPLWRRSATDSKRVATDAVRDAITAPEPTSANA